MILKHGSKTFLPFRYSNKCFEYLHVLNGTFSDLFLNELNYFSQNELKLICFLIHYKIQTLSESCCVSNCCVSIREIKNSRLLKNQFWKPKKCIIEQQKNRTVVKWTKMCCFFILCRYVMQPHSVASVLIFILAASQSAPQLPLACISISCTQVLALIRILTHWLATHWDTGTFPLTWLGRRSKKKNISKADIFDIVFCCCLKHIRKHYFCYGTANT